MIGRPTGTPQTNVAGDPVSSAWVILMAYWTTPKENDYCCQEYQGLSTVMGVKSILLFSLKVLRAFNSN